MARDNLGHFLAGTSGNPSGRPAKEKCLTDALIKALKDDFSINVNGNTIRVIPVDQLAKYVVDACMTGEVHMITGEKIVLGADQLPTLWFNTMNRVDGPPAQEIEQTMNNPILWNADETVTKDDDDKLERPVPTDGEAIGSTESDPRE